MRTRGTIAVVLLAACGRATGAPEGVGTLEAVEVRVAPTIAARVVALRVEEGAMARRGDTLALLTTPTLSAERTQRQARAAAARSAVSELDAGARTDERRRAEAELAAADADAQRTAADSVRVSGLAARQIVSAQQLDGARAAA
ncbi:MAG: biotin/lipoyl-binding protein, partial [Gemmatimonadaceae bacterium]|nr:biotin/lipoyl-binding protein [Gemmatimonadaceae bacterium]